MGKIKYLIKNEFAVLPADTLYALSINVFSSRSNEIYGIKGRSGSTPTPVGVYDLEMMYEISYVPEIVKKIMEKEWSFLVTVVLKNKKVPETLVGKTVGLRIPKNPTIREIIKDVGPITLTSANLHGGKNPVTINDAYEQLGEKIPIYLDCGKMLGVPSTVVDFTSEKPKLIREGAVPFELVKNIYEP